MFYPDFLGAIIGIMSIAGICYLYEYVDDLSDGNIEKEFKNG